MESICGLMASRRYSSDFLVRSANNRIQVHKSKIPINNDEHTNVLDNIDEGFQKNKIHVFGKHVIPFLVDVCQKFSGTSDLLLFEEFCHSTKQPEDSSDENRNLKAIKLLKWRVCRTF